MVVGILRQAQMLHDAAQETQRNCIPPPLLTLLRLDDWGKSSTLRFSHFGGTRL